jgi:hypothetical protein
MFDGASETLTEVADKAGDEELKKVIAAARDQAVANREVIEADFRKRYVIEFDKLSKKANKGGAASFDFSLDELSLVEEDDLNETLKFNDLAARLGRYCEEDLAALDQRAGVILGDATLERDANPFGTTVIANAYKHACRQVDVPAEYRLVWIKLIEGDVLAKIRDGYHEVNDLFVENGILPKIRYSVTKNEGGRPPPSLDKDGGGDKDKAGAAPAAPEEEGDIFSKLSKLLGPGTAGGGAPPAPGMGVGNIPIVQGQQLMSSLTQLQVGDLSALGEAAAQLGPILAEAGNLKNVLHQLKETQVGQGMGQMDAMTLDIVAMLFDQLFDDPKIPIALKGLIGRLQLPMLKVAIADKDLFTKKTHPARQLLDSFGQIGLRLPQEFDAQHPVFPKLEAFIQELEKGFAEKMEIFDKVRTELEAIIAEDDKRVAVEMQPEEKQMVQAETLAIAKVVAQEEIKARVAVAPKVPFPLIQFIAEQWIKHLIMVYAKEGKDSPQWKTALETMDQLFWSVAPKATPEEKKKFPATIAPMLKNIRSGVAAAGIDNAVATAFFGELMKLHTEVMKATAVPPPPPPAAASKPGAPGAKPGAPPPKGAKPAPAPKPAEEQLDFTQPLTVNNPFGEGQVDVSAEDLDFTAAMEGSPPALEEQAAPAGSPAKPAAPAAPGKTTPQQAAAPYLAKFKTPVRIPSTFVIGTWVEILKEDDTKQYALLHYVSPMKSHFLFVDRRGKKVYECSRTMLSRRMKLGEVKMLEGEPDPPLFDRLMEGLLGKARGGLPGVPA